MSVVVTEVVTPMLNPSGLLVMTQNTTTGAMALVGTAVYKTQAEALAALEAAAAVVGQTTRYVIVRYDLLSGRLATVS
jgi:hypothetical protein